jgi:hypothetical protein
MGFGECYGDCAYGYWFLKWQECYAEVGFTKWPYSFWAEPNYSSDKTDEQSVKNYLSQSTATRIRNTVLNSVSDSPPKFVS